LSKDLRDLLQDALWRWPEDSTEALALWSALLVAAGKAASPGDLAAWVADLEETDPADRKRAQLLARGMRLLAAAAPDPPRTRARTRRKKTGAPPPSRATQNKPGPAAEPEGEPLTVLKGCGPRTAERLAGRSLHTVPQLLGLLPLGYEDRRRLTPLAELTAGRSGCTTGTVVAQRWLGRGRRRFFELVVEEDGAQLLCRWFRTYPGLGSRFPTETRVWVSGAAKDWRGKLQMAHPLVRVLDEDVEPEPEGIVPRYPTVEGVGQGLLRSLCDQAVTRCAHLEPEPVPPDLRQKLDLPGRPEALRMLHQPPPTLSDPEMEALEHLRSPAHLRLIFDELFLLQLGLAQRRREVKDLSAAVYPSVESSRLNEIFPFTLTAAQARVIEEISADLAHGEPMHRLVQGDVGSGKTAVAFAAAVQVISAGGQVALMAPTEILAAQHAQTLGPWLKKLGHRLSLLTASTPRGARESILSLLAAGQLPLVVGTHALLAERVEFGSLGLVIVDEQHRFGVAQRARLRDKGESVAGSPHLLVMTATPIPRTLALTAYGDLDVSVVDELPAGRTPAKTHVFTARQRAKVFRRVKRLLGKGKRAFVVCPLVEESDKLDLADAERTHAELSETMAPHPVGLVHGRLDADEKTRVLDAFRRGDLSMLVATTVVEVGVDIPDADLMVVESAQRFGLAQLHQLRGRVGRRAGAEPLCLLIADPGATADARRRLKVMEETGDGFRIAEEDLNIRGPGELLGLRQAGESGLALAAAAANPRLLSTARQTAQRLIRDDPDLQKPEHEAANRLLAARWSGRLFGEEAG
jgi:ATP-dependent DNA helicase RecG